MLVVTLTELLNIIKHFWGKFKTIFFVLCLAFLMLLNFIMPFGSEAHEVFLDRYNIQQIFIRLCQTAIVFLAPVWIVFTFIRWLLTPEGDN